MFTVLLFTGCANVKFTAVDSGTYILQGVQVTLDEQIIISKEASLDEIKDTINDCADTLHDNSYNSFVSNLQNLLINESLTPSQCQTILDSVQISKQWTANNIFVYELKFNNAFSNEVDLTYMEVFYLYNYGTTIPPEDEEDENDITYEWLATKVSSTNTTTFANTDSIEQFFTARLGGLGFTDEDVSYTYVYGTNYSRLHSDADKIEKVNDIYLHTWELDSKDQEITLYRIIANTTSWYIIALIIGAVTALSISIVVLVKKKKTPKIDTDFDIK